RRGGGWGKRGGGGPRFLFFRARAAPADQRRGRGPPLRAAAGGIQGPPLPSPPPGAGIWSHPPPRPPNAAGAFCIGLKLQLIPLWPVPKFAHQLRSARASVVESDKAADMIKTKEVVRINASSTALPDPAATLAGLMRF